MNKREWKTEKWASVPRSNRYLIYCHDCESQTMHAGSPALCLECRWREEVGVAQEKLSNMSWDTGVNNCGNCDTFYTGGECPTCEFLDIDKT